MYKDGKQKKFLETVEFFASENKWECVGENDQVVMYEKLCGKNKVRLNVYPNRTIHPVINKQSKKSYKKVTDSFVEDIFKNPFKAAEDKITQQKTNQQLLEEIRDLKQRVSDLEQAFADSKIIPFDI